MAPQAKSASTHDIESAQYSDSDIGVEKTLRDFEGEHADDTEQCWVCRLGSRCLCLGGFVVLIGAAVAGLSVALTGDPNPANYFIPIDPPGAKEAVRWNANAGLYLTIENACDDSWTPFFDQSLLDWNVSESLILSSQRVPYDADCNPSRGRLKVCNGNYGNTDWRGLNTAVVSVSTGFVVYSVSKLNDFHLETDDDKLYTM